MLEAVMQKLKQRKSKESTKAAEQKIINEKFEKVKHNTDVQTSLTNLSSRYSVHSKKARETTMKMTIAGHSLMAITVPKSLNLIAERFGNCLRTNSEAYTKHKSCSNSAAIIPHLENVNISLVIDEADNKSLSAAYWGFVGNDIIIFWIDALARPQMRREEDNKEKVQQLMLMQAKYLSKLTDGKVYIYTNKDYINHSYNTLNVNKARLSATMIYKLVEMTFNKMCISGVVDANSLAQIIKEKDLKIQETVSAVKKEYEKVDFLSPQIAKDENGQISLMEILKQATISNIQDVQNLSSELILILPEAFKDYVKKTLNWESIVKEHINFLEKIFSRCSINPLIPDHLDTKLNFGLDAPKFYKDMDNISLNEMFQCSLLEVDTDAISIG